MIPSEKFCVIWNDFQTNISTSFHDLRNDREFTDVTLVCEGNQRIEAHKVILASASNVLKNILAENKHPHPLIFIKEINRKMLALIVDYIYNGETNMLLDDLENFKELAAELAVKGLTSSAQNLTNKPSNETIIVKSNKKSILQHESCVMEDQNCEKIFTDGNQMNPFEHIVNENVISTEMKLKVPFKKDCDLYEQIVCQLERINGTWTCKLCGKIGTKAHLKKHVETHIEGIKHPCYVCGLSSKTRDALQVHMFIVHRGNNSE